MRQVGIFMGKFGKGCDKLSGRCRSPASTPVVKKPKKWRPRITSVSEKWSKMIKWIKDSEDALSESESYLRAENKSAINPEDIQDLAAKISQLLSVFPILETVRIPNLNRFSGKDELEL